MLPTGTVTFLLTDIEGSTKLWQAHEDAMGHVVERHDEIVAEAIGGHDGVLVKSKGEGDSTFSVFTRPSDAVSAAVGVQHALDAEAWPNGIELRVRAAIHTGEAELRDGDYYGSAVNRCARLRAVAHGGQTICSQTTADLVADAPLGVTLRSLGTHRLKDLERPEHVHQVGDEEFAPLRSLDAFRHNLPTQRTSFIGRWKQLNHVAKLLADNRLVTLTGIGGCGKTRLSLQVAAEELDRFEDGVFFCELASISEPEDVPVQLARAIALPLGGGAAGPSTVRDDLLDALASQHALLILDNCEHLVELCAGLVDDILDACPRVHVLATTREALEVEGERTFSVPSLETPADEGFEEAESVRLFCDRAAGVLDGFSLTPEIAGSIAEICRRLDGIPLAIELAAGQVATLTPQQITDRLEDRFMLLTGGRRRVQRQHTLAAALDWSYDLLGVAEQAFLLRLSVFPGTFTLEQAEAICASGLTTPGVHLLRALVSKSLVETSEASTGRRYRLLETVRLYAEEKLLASGEANELRSAHRDFFVSWAGSLRQEQGSDTYGVRIVAEAANLRGALTWALEEDRRHGVATIAGAALPLWNEGNLDEGERWLSEGLTADDVDPMTRFNCLVQGAWVAIARLDLPAWGMRAEEAVALSGSASTPAGACVAHAQLALYRAIEAFFMGGDERRDDARELARRSRELHAEAGDGLGTQGWDAVSGLLALAYAALGDFDDAARVLDYDTGPTAGRQRHALLAMLHSLRGAYDLALEEGEKVVRALGRATMVPPMMSVWLRLPTALALGGVGRHDEALSFVRELAAGSPETLAHGVGTSTVIVLAAMADLRGDHDRAARLIGAASTAMEAGNARSPLDLILRDHHVARIAKALGDEAMQELVAEGRRLSINEAIELGLRSG